MSQNNISKCSGSSRSAVDDKEVLINVEDELDKIKKKISGTSGESAIEESVWQRKEPDVRTPVLTLVRRPRSDRSATVCVTDLHNSNNQHSTTGHDVSKSEQDLDSNILRQSSLKGIPTKSFNSRFSNFSNSDAKGKTSTVRNFVQSFERLKDLSQNGSSSHSPSDLFPAHRSALVTRDLRTTNNSISDKNRHPPKSSTTNSAFKYDTDTKVNEKLSNATDLNKVKLGEQPKFAATGFLKSRHNSLIKAKVTTNNVPPQNYDGSEKLKETDRYTLTRPRDTSLDRKLQRGCISSDGYMNNINTNIDENYGYVCGSNQFSNSQPRRWTVSKQAREACSPSIINTYEDDQELTSRHASFSGFSRLARANSLSKFDDNDEYLQSPPIHRTKTSISSTAQSRNISSADQNGHTATCSRPLFRLPNLPPFNLTSMQGYVNRAGTPGLEMCSSNTDDSSRFYSRNGSIDHHQFSTLRHPTSSHYSDKKPRDKIGNDRQRTLSVDYPPFSMVNCSPSSSAMTEEMQALEIRRLRQDLQWAKEQVALLTTKLSNNANVVEAFDRSLAGISQRLIDLTTTSQNKNGEVSELLRTVEVLRNQNFTVYTGSTGRTTPSIVQHPRRNGHDWLTRQASSDSVHSLDSSTASVFSTNSTSEQPADHFGKKSSVKNWLRSSFGKAFSRRKISQKATGEPEFCYVAATSCNVSHANSMPSIPVPNEDLISFNSAYDGHPSCGYKTPVTNMNIPLSSATVTRATAAAASSSYQQLGHSSSITALPTTLERMGSVKSCHGRGQSVTCAHQSRNNIIHYNDITVNAEHTHKRNESSDAKVSASQTSPLDLLTLERQNAGSKRLPVAVALSTENSFSQETKTRETSVVIGSISICSNTTWDSLDSMIRRVFQEYLIRIDPNTSLGLNGESVYSYTVGEINRKRGSSPPELLPVGYMVGDVTGITVNLKGHAEKSVDLLAFETLIPKSFIQRYLKLLLEHRRVILSGSSGTGKTYLAQRLAECLVTRTQPATAAESIAIFRVDSQSSKELRQYLSNMADRCENRKDKVPLVIILDNLHHVSSLSDVFSGYLDAHYENSPYIIGTMNQATCSSNDLQLHHNFRWVLYANHIEPVRTFLGRYLRRQLIPVEVSSPPVDQELIKVIDWLPKVWQHINKFLEVHSSCDITIGPRLFLSCPLDTTHSQVWFNDLWNYSIVPYLLEAVREGIQAYGCRAPWEDLADWIVGSYPWSKHNLKPSLLRLRPEDVGYDGTSVSPTREISGGVSEVKPTPTDKPSEVDTSLMEILTRLQEAAMHSDSDTNSTDGQSQSEKKRDGRQSNTPSLSDTNSTSSQYTIAKA